MSGSDRLIASGTRAFATLLVVLWLSQASWAGNDECNLHVASEHTGLSATMPVVWDLRYEEDMPVLYRCSRQAAEEIDPEYDRATGQEPMVGEVRRRHWSIFRTELVGKQVGISEYLGPVATIGLYYRLGDRRYTGGELFGPSTLCSVKKGPRRTFFYPIHMSGASFVIIPSFPSVAGTILIGEAGSSDPTAMGLFNPPTLTIDENLQFGPMSPVEVYDHGGSAWLVLTTSGHVLRATAEIPKDQRGGRLEDRLPNQTSRRISIVGGIGGFAREEPLAGPSEPTRGEAYEITTTLCAGGGLLVDGSLPALCVKFKSGLRAGDLRIYRVSPKEDSVDSSLLWSEERTEI